jgi:hypothetical protein
MPSLATTVVSALLHVPMATSLEGYVGGGYTMEIAPTASVARVGAGLSGELLGAGLFFETSVGHFGGLDEGCYETGAAMGGCLYAPRTLGGQVSVTPLRWRHVELMAMVVSGWTRREVYRRDERRDDWVVGGGLGVGVVWLPVFVRLQPRYLRYVTYAPRGFNNTDAVALTLDVGVRFDVW